MIKRIRSLKFRIKFLLLLVFSLAVSIFVCYFLIININSAWQSVQKLPGFFHFDEEAFVSELRGLAANYNVPAYDGGKNHSEQMEGFFATADDYTGVYVYGTDDGLYRASCYPKVFDFLGSNSLLDWGTSITDIYNHNTYEKHNYEIVFQNGIYDVYIQNYRNTLFVYPYLIFCMLCSVALFLFIVLGYIGRRMKQILCLKDEILLMAGGDLSHPISPCGFDEIGTLAEELDHLRTSFAETIAREEESRNANQDLITAMSHDLRTPLTILKGYLEILKLKRNDPALAEEYLDRCMRKADDIREMTDKMFEYALVFEDKEEPVLTDLPTGIVFSCLHENMDFLSLTGFTIEYTPDFTESSSAELFSVESGILLADATMLKRIFNNLFSNILKYGDKAKPVTVSCRLVKGEIGISLQNAIKSDRSQIASNKIGLRSTAKMVELHHGSFSSAKKGDSFTVEIVLPLKA